MNRKSQLVCAIAAVLAGSPVYAQVNLYDGTGAPTWMDGKGASTWVQELDLSVLVPALIGNAGTGSIDAFDVRTITGFGFPSTQMRYIRLELDNGAKFTHTPKCVVPAPHECKDRTGGKGYSFVTYKYIANSLAADPTIVNDVDPTDEIKISFNVADGFNGGVAAPAGIIPADKSTVKATYTLHNNDVSADAGPDGTGILYTASADYLKFGSALSSGFSAVDTLIADVGSSFTKFLNGGTVGSIGKINPIDFTSASLLTVNVPTAATANQLATLAALTTGATLTVEGDFSYVQDVVNGTPAGTYTGATQLVYLSPTNATTCPSSPDVAATSVTEGSATFDLTGQLASLPRLICVKPNGTSPITIATYNANLSFVPNKGYLDLAGSSLPDIGRIQRNGTVLDTPYFTFQNGYISRVYLTNTHPTLAAPYVAYPISDNGQLVWAGPTIKGTIPANGNLMLFYDPARTDSTLVAGVTLGDVAGKPRGAMRFVITGNNKNIQGVYQTINTKTVEVQSVVMMRPGGGDGQ